jgi:hypothetical protein
MSSNTALLAEDIEDAVLAVTTPFDLSDEDYLFHAPADVDPSNVSTTADVVTKVIWMSAPQVYTLNTSRTVMRIQCGLSLYWRSSGDARSLDAQQERQDAATAARVAVVNLMRLNGNIDSLIIEDSVNQTIGAITESDGSYTQNSVRTDFTIQYEELL